jgi:hypothetical protein
MTKQNIDRVLAALQNESDDVTVEFRHDCNTIVLHMTDRVEEIQLPVDWYNYSYGMLSTEGTPVDGTP